MDVLKIIRERKSVRSFDGKALTEEHKEMLEAFIRELDDPFGMPVTFQIFDAKEHGLRSPVLTGDTLYMTAKMKWQENAETAYGYQFEQAVLYACSLGIGTTWIGGTMNRAAFEQASDLAEDEKMPCVTPLGYPAAKRSVREVMMRKGVKADVRMPVKELFFENGFDTPLSKEKQEVFADMIEAIRWAPSAVNKQPWRIVEKEGIWHFYEKQDKGFTGDSTGDLQKIDVGIALCHFVLMAREKGYTPEIIVSDPGIAAIDQTAYVVSVKL